MICLAKSHEIFEQEPKELDFLLLIDNKGAGTGKI